MTSGFAALGANVWTVGSSSSSSPNGGGDGASAGGGGAGGATGMRDTDDG
jgi:hypothetical protein